MTKEEMMNTALASITQEIKDKQDREFIEAAMSGRNEGEACGHVLAWDKEHGTLFLRLETEGTDEFEIMEGIERVKETDPVQMKACPDGTHMAVYSGRHCLGTLPEQTGNAILVLEKEALLAAEPAIHSLVPVSRRGRYAKRAVVWIDIHAVIKEPAQ